MYKDPNLLSSDSRVWVYQSNRKLNDDEVSAITELGKNFAESWTAHNKMLTASFEIKYNIFLILMVDQNSASASGCSIDKSVHFIQHIEKQFSINLLDRMIFAFKDSDDVKLVKRNEFNELIKSRKITDETIVFNNLIETKGDLETRWELPLSESWHKSAMF